MRGPLAEIKKLRWSYVERQYDQDAAGYVYSYIRRLDKIGGRVLEELLERGGGADVVELAEALGVRVRDLLRDDRQLRARPAKHLADRTVIDYDLAGRVGAIVRLADAGMVRLNAASDYVQLTDDWCEKLGIARQVGGEYEAEDRTRQRHAKDRRKYKERHKIKPDRAPTEAEMDEAREAREAREADGSAAELQPLSALAAAMAAYLERNPHDAAQPPGWIGSTLWALELYPERTTPAQARAALAELGGDDYRRELLELGNLGRRGA